MSSAMLTGSHPQLGTMFAAIDPDARYVTPAVQSLRFAALLSPFPDVAEAEAALVEAGAVLPEGGGR